MGSAVSIPVAAATSVTSAIDLKAALAGLDGDSKKKLAEALVLSTANTAALAGLHGDSKKKLGEALFFTNANTSPEQWGMTIAQFSEFWDKAVVNEDIDARGGAHMYEVCEKMVKPLTRGTGRSVALGANKNKPLTAQLMISHAWKEAFLEVHEAVTTHCRNTNIAFSTLMWFCTLAQYQAGDEPGDCGPTIQEQIAKDPFGKVLQAIANAPSGVGILVAHVTQLDLYERLWCVYEINAAMNLKLDIQAVLSEAEKDRWNRVRSKWISDGPENGGWDSNHPDPWDGLMPRIFETTDTSKAKCSRSEDEVSICAEVNRSGGFDRLNQVVDEFRKTTFLKFM